MTDTAVSESQTAAPGGTAERARLQPARTQKIGRVVSDKMDKTVVVAVDFVKRHPIYHKRMTRTTRFLAHDEQNSCRPGDIVRIEETRPLSARKRWIVREIVERGVQL